MIKYLVLGCIILFGCQSTREEMNADVENLSRFYRINCGDSETHTDLSGHIWTAEQVYTEGSWGYVGGSSVWRGRNKVANSLAHRVYNNERYGMEAWRFTVENGSYEVQLHFAETYDKAYQIGARTFNVSLEGSVVLEQFDIFKEAGAEFTALVKEFPVTITDGILDIEFYDLENNSLINGIVISRK
ncbi:MAG: hypothetical protein HRU15_03230 [Planctomycetes bacterium]|nr:hypothetical protein [Planctomycetota bacterium]